MSSSTRKSFRRSSTYYVLIGALAAHTAGCSPGYVMRAAYEQSRILLGRRSIEKAIADERTPPEDRQKLQCVLKARQFGEQIGLRPGKSFTEFSDVGKDTLAWVVVASRKDAFSPYTWWFPIVGTVPYKGFFDQEDAKQQAQQLEEQGYESSVRGTEAFSTLGWFNDPVLSTTLKNPIFRIANTVLHESVHSTVWIKDNVPFNETLASFVGSQASVEFFQHELARAHPSDLNYASLAASLEAAQRDHLFQADFAATITTLYEALSNLYAHKELATEQKIVRRVEVFDATMKPFRQRYPQLTALRAINNAEIMQFTIYMTKYELFDRLFSKVNHSWRDFFARIATIQEDIENGRSHDPFEELRKAL